MIRNIFFRKTEYYFHSDKDDEAIAIISKYNHLDSYVNERLKTMGSFDLYTLYTIDENLSRALSVMEKGYDLCFEYYNVDRLKAICQNRTALLFNQGDYEEALVNRRGDLLFNCRCDIQEKRRILKSCLSSLCFH